MPDVVLITGVSRYLGGAFARALSQVEDGPRRIIGVDVIPPPHAIGRAEFLRADIRSPMSHRDPAMFTEDMATKRLPNVGFGKDSVEVEAYVRGFARRRPDVGITMLRLANVIGPQMKTAMTDYFRLPVIPIPLGWDARLQFVHEEDVARAVVAATLGPAAGTVNVAGSGIITVSQAVSLAGRPFLKIPGPASRALSGVFKRTGLIDFSPEQLDLLVYGRGLDTTWMREALGFEPHFTTREAFEDFVYSAPRPIDTAMHSAAGLAEDAGLWLRSVAGAIPIGRS